MTVTAVQLSLATTSPAMSGKSVVQPTPTSIVREGAQATTVGAVVSTTVKMAEHVELLPEASVAVIVTVVMPVVIEAPAAGDCVTTTAQASLVAMPVRSGTWTEQFAPALSVWLAAQAVMLGAVVSTTVTVAVHVELLPAASVAVIVTTVGPNAATVPAAGDCVSVTALQLSFADTPPVRSGIVEAQFALASKVWLAAQVVMNGAVVSATVKVAVQDVELPEASDTVMVTIVAPRLAVEPAAGDWTVEDTPQLSTETTPAVKSGTSAVQVAPAEMVWSAAQVVMLGSVVSTPSTTVAVAVATLPLASVTVSV